MTAEIKHQDLTGFQNLSDLLHQLLKYATVGVANTLIDAAAYYALTRWLGLDLLPVLAKGIAYAVGMVNSFYWNRTWTFQTRTNLLRAGVLFMLTHVAALGINTGVMALMYNFLDCPEVIALGFATAISFGWNFLLNRCVVFKPEGEGMFVQRT